MAFSLGFGSSRSSGSSQAQGTRTASQLTSEQQRQTGTVTNREQTNQATNSQQQSSTSSTGQVLSEQILSSLDTDTQETLKALIQQLSTADGGESAIGQALGTLALNTGVDTQPIVANARRKGEIQIGQAKQQLARGAGSSMNSLVQQFGLEEARSLETELASLEASLQQQNQASQLTALSTAFSAEQTGGSNQIDQIAKLTEVLKGATQSQTGSQTSTETATQLVNALSQLTGTTDAQQLQDLLTAITGSTTSDESFKETGSTRGRTSGFGVSFASA